MKKLFCVLVTLLMVMTLFPAAGAEEVPFRFTRDNFPVLDGSTSLVPLGQGIAGALLGVSREEAASIISFHRTTQSFRNLREGSCDLVIAAEPNAIVFDEMDEAGFAYQLETIAREALVFVVNENNPVNSLTREQVKKIYSGEITNWSEVGGDDLPIEAFQRNPTSGSQVMMEKLVMEGTPMMEAPVTNIPGQMAELIEAVRSFDNSANAIGYTVYYYAADMQMAKGLKILQIDGILPSAESLQSELYPYINGYYCCISADAAPESPARRLFNWLLSEEGQNLLRLEGYVPVYAPGEAPNPAEIAVDYSEYTPAGGLKAQYTDFDCPKDHLEASDAYGLIYPYEGERLYSARIDDQGGPDDYYSGATRGFYNYSGQRITDPVYTAVHRISFGDGSFFWSFRNRNDLYGFAACDGSTVIEPVYEGIQTVGDWIFCHVNYENGIFDIYNRDFEKIYTQDDFILDGRRLVPFERKDGMINCQVLVKEWEFAGYVLLDEQLHILAEADGYISMDMQNRILLFDGNWDVTMTDLKGNIIPLDGEDKVNAASVLNGNFLSVRKLDDTKAIVDRNGMPFLRDFVYANCDDTGRFLVFREDTIAVYDAEGHVLCTNIPAAWSPVYGTVLFTEETEAALVIHDPVSGTEAAIPGGCFASQAGRLIEVSVVKDGVWSNILLDADLNPLEGVGGSVYPVTDAYTGEEYLMAYAVNGFSDEMRLYTPDGAQELFRANGSLMVADGCYIVSDDWAYVCYDAQGGVIFCYPYYGFASGD